MKNVLRRAIELLNLLSENENQQKTLKTVF